MILHERFLARLYINYFNFNLQVLHVANIGDSGFIVIRNGAVFKRSSAMVHEFNFPLQIERYDDPTEFIEVHWIKVCSCLTKSSILHRHNFLEICYKFK
jgi:serine/threonine protein phosphatase PrpC